MKYVFLILFIVFMNGCTSTHERSQTPRYWGKGATSPVYQVVEVKNPGERLTLFIQYQAHPDVTGFYTISESTGVFKQRPGTKESDHLADPVHPTYIKPGMQILLYPEGIIQDSIPARGAAGEIIILG